MIKNFKNWFHKKRQTENKKISVQYKKREIFWTRIGENIGFEQDGKGNDFLRPVLIFRKFNSHVFWGIPLTTSIQKNGKFYFKFNACGKKQNAILSQIRLFDAKRLEEKIGMIAIDDFKSLEKAIQKLLDDF